MTESEIYRVLGEIFAGVFLRDDIVLDPALGAKDVDGCDSFKHIELMMSVGKRFGVKLSAKDIEGPRCVGDLAAVIARKAA